MQTEQIILQTRLVQIDEVSHSSQASSSQFPSRAHSRQQTKQQFTLSLNQCQEAAFDNHMNAAEFKNQITKVMEEDDIEDNNDYYLSPHLLALESKMET